jgi:hypothetical protein
MDEVVPDDEWVDPALEFQQELERIDAGGKVDDGKDLDNQALIPKKKKRFRHEFYWAPGIPTIDMAAAARKRGNPIPLIKKTKMLFDAEPQPWNNPHKRAVELSANLTEVIEGRITDKAAVDAIMYRVLGIAWIVNKTEIGIPW